MRNLTFVQESSQVSPAEMIENITKLSKYYFDDCIVPSISLHLLDELSFMVSACLKSNDLLFFNRLDAKHLDVSAKSNPLVSFCTKPGFYIHSVVCFRRQMKLFQRITSALHLSHVRLKQEQTDVGVPYALSISVMQ